MLTLHHLEYSQSFRILWLLEALAIPYALETYERDPDTKLAPAAYKALSPLGTAPVITDGDFALAETNAIVDYLLDRHPNPQLRPPADAPHRARFLFWFHVGQGSLTPLLMMETLFTIIKQRVPFFMKPFVSIALGRAGDGFIKPRLNALLTKAEADLAQAPWFGGDALSVADIVLSYSIESASLKGFISDEHPHCREWLQRVYEDPAFQAAKAKDGREQMVLAH
ncbi:MAG: glutathione S-transferase family protein [Pseudomonadota bacterium]